MHPLPRTFSRRPSANCLLERWRHLSTLATISKHQEESLAASLLPLAPTMWRYDAVLPEATPVTLGEGFTPMLRSREFPNVFIKDEGLNPTGSFKARGLSAAVTMARHFGLKSWPSPLPETPLAHLPLMPPPQHRSSHLHAQRCAYGQPHRVRLPRRARHAGRWPHLRLRPQSCRAQTE